MEYCRRRPWISMHHLFYKSFHLHLNEISTSISKLSLLQILFNLRENDAAFWNALARGLSLTRPIFWLLLSYKMYIHMYINFRFTEDNFSYFYSPFVFCFIIFILWQFIRCPAKEDVLPQYASSFLQIEHLTPLPFCIFLKYCQTWLGGILNLYTFSRFITAK